MLSDYNDFLIQKGVFLVWWGLDLDKFKNIQAKQENTFLNPKFKIISDFNSKARRQKELQHPTITVENIIITTKGLLERKTQLLQLERKPQLLKSDNGEKKVI